MATALERATWGYNHADYLDAQNYPYIFGGGHPSPHLPWVKWNSTFTGTEPAKGPDCSGGVCNILWYMGVLGTQEANNTEWLEQYGVSGAGKYVTIYVLDEPDGGIHHTFLKFTNLKKPHAWWAATHTGGTVGWQDTWKDTDSWLQGYRKRHPEGL